MAVSALSVLLYIGGGLLALVCAGFLAFSAYIYYIHWKYSHLPCPKYSSFYRGHLAEIYKRMQGDEECPYHSIYYDWYLETGSTVYVVFFWIAPFVIALDPDSIKKLVMQVKNNKNQKFQTKQLTHIFGERLLGSGIVAIPDYDSWKPRRKIYNPAFTKSHLASFVPPFNECVDLFLDKMRLMADGNTPIPMKEFFNEFSLYTLGKVAFGTDFFAQWDDKSPGLKRAKGSGSVLFLLSNVLKGMTFAISPFFKYLHPFEAEGYRESVRAIRMMGRDCIMKRIKMIEDGVEAPNDILAHILQLISTKEKVDIEDLIDDFVNFYVAGYETTSNLLSLAVPLILLHPVVLERVKMEVDEVLGTKEQVSGEDLEKLQYTEQVLHETLRLHSPSVGLSREVGEDTMLGDHYIPAGSLVILPTVVTSRMPEYFDDPYTFNPNRFDPENEPPNSFIYFPFGVGHRSCVAKPFALMEAKIILARLIQTFKLTLPPDYKLEITLRATQQPKDDVPCTAALRLK